MTIAIARPRPSQLPTRCGIGLRARHLETVIAERPAVAWFEVHAENYMGEGPAVEMLERIRADYPLSLHGVGLSLGGADRPDPAHLARLATAIRRFAPAAVSEHLAWSGTRGRYLNDLLPLPWTEEALRLVARNIDEAQAALGCRLLIENPSGYLRFRHSTMREEEFLSALVARTGCGILCDVNNVCVSAHNLGFSPIRYLDGLPADAVGEIHLAGHASNDADGMTVLIDDHGSRVAPNVWVLFAHALARFGRQPALIEWDTDVPPLDILQAEARTADLIADAVAEGAHHAAAG